MKVDIILSNSLGITPVGTKVHSKDNIWHLFDIHGRSFLHEDFMIHLNSPLFSSWFFWHLQDSVKSIVSWFILALVLWTSLESWNFLNYTLTDYLLLYAYTPSIDKGGNYPKLLWHDFFGMQIKTFFLQYNLYRSSVSLHLNKQVSQLGRLFQLPNWWETPGGAWERCVTELTTMQQQLSCSNCVSRIWKMIE